MGHRHACSAIASVALVVALVTLAGCSGRDDADLGPIDGRQPALQVVIDGTALPAAATREAIEGNARQAGANPLDADVIESAAAQLVVAHLIEGGAAPPAVVVSPEGERPDAAAALYGTLDAFGGAHDPGELDDLRRWLVGEMDARGVRAIAVATGDIPHEALVARLTPHPEGGVAP